MEAELSSFFHHKSEPVKQIASWPNEVETIQLISRFLAGDPDAAAELIAHEQWICGRIAWRVDDQSEQEDVQQDAWVRIFPLLLTYDPQIATFRTFALPCVDSAMVDYHRRKKRFPVLSDDSSNGQSPQEPDRHPSPCDWAQFDELFGALHKLFHGDSPPHELFAFTLGALLQWKPNEVWTELREQPFAILLPNLQRALVEQLEWRPAYVGQMLGKLQQTINTAPTVEMAIVNAKTKRHYAAKCQGLLNRRVGRTSLLEYCSAGADEHEFSSDFSNWSMNVMKRLREDFFDE